MGETKDFSAKVETGVEAHRAIKQRQEARAAELALKASQEAEYAERQRLLEAEQTRQRKVLLETQEADESLHQGTSPEDVWGENSVNARACKEFINFMSERQLIGSNFLRSTNPSDSWSISGYGIGGIGSRLWTPKFVDRRRQLGKNQENPHYNTPYLHVYRGTLLADNVFLCEDGNLRLYTARDYVDQIRHISLGLSVRVPDTTNRYPDTLSDLPLKDYGQPVTPSIGTYELSQVTRWAMLGERYSPRPFMEDGIQYGPSYGELTPVPTGIRKGGWREVPLETLLVNYAKAAEIALSETR